MRSTTCRSVVKKHKNTSFLDKKLLHVIKSKVFADLSFCLIFLKDTKKAKILIEDNSQNTAS